MTSKLSAWQVIVTSASNRDLQQSFSQFRRVRIAHLNA
jgi:hypothetical protein